MLEKRIKKLVFPLEVSVVLWAVRGKVSKGPDDVEIGTGHGSVPFSV